MKNIQEIAISIILIILLGLLLNPFWMPDALVMTILICLVLVFAIFAIFVYRENSQDEREELHKLKSSRIAFLAGSLVLIAGIVIESLDHSLNIWLVLALGAMILSKLVGLAYNRVSS